MDNVEKLDGKTFDVISDNIKKLEELFPEIVTEGKVDIDKLALLFDKDRNKYEDETEEDKKLKEVNIKKDGEERYEFTWKGKKEAIRMAQKQTTGTLRPCRKESVNFDETQNLYIEGDNLEVLRALQSSYRGKVKMIYIDPPYNTGNDFVYKDDFSDNVKNYKERMKESYKTNTDNSGRYHTNWLNMMYPRLKLAKNLLTEDGVIFISLDDNEVTNLKKICDEVFGEINFIGNFIWRGGRRNAAKVVSTSHEYMIAFSKNISYCMENNILWREKKKGLDKIYSKASSLVKYYNENFELASKELKDWYKTLSEDDESKLNEHYCWVDKKGVYFASDISRGGGGGPKWDITNPTTGELVKPPARGYAYSNIEDLKRDIELGLIHFNGNGVPCKKRYLKDNEAQLIETVFYKDRRGSSKRLRSLMDGNIFDFPKDENIISEKIESFTNKDDIILDFFSGSATTAHSVMQLNAEDGGSRKFIMVQLPEETDEKSEAYKAGYKNICEIGKERIRRAGKKILEENKDKEGIEDLDTGFKVFKLDTTNIKEWDDTIINTDEIKWNVEELINPIKDGRSQEDVIYEILLKYGVDLSMPIEEVEIMGSKVYSVGFGYLMICLEKDISLDLIEAIGEQKPNRVVLYDNGLDNESKTNGERILKELGVKDIRTI